MLKVKDIAQARTYVYLNPEDNYRISDSFYWRLETAVKRYRKANNYPIGSGWTDQFEANVCANSSGVCADFVPPSPRQKIESVARALGRYVRSGMRTRSAEEIETILSDYCRDGTKLGGPCNYYGGQNGLLKIVCQKCGCGGLKLAMRSEHCPLRYW